MADESSFLPLGTAGRHGALGLTTLRKADLLRGVEVFSLATVDELYRLAGLARVVEFAPAAVIFGENDISDSFYVLAEGSVELTYESRKGRHQMGPGEAVGLYSVLTREPRGSTATVLEPTTALAVSAEDLYTFLSNNMEIVVSMFKYFVRKLNLGPS